MATIDRGCIIDGSFLLCVRTSVTKGYSSAKFRGGRSAKIDVSEHLEL